jgi:hypothetical protein
MKSYVPAIAVTVVSTLIATALTAAGLRSYKKWGTMRRSSQAFTISAGLMILVVIVLKLTPGDNSGLLADVIVTAIFLAWCRGRPIALPGRRSIEVKAVGRPRSAASACDEPSRLRRRRHQHDCLRQLAAV